MLHFDGNDKRILAQIRLSGRTVCQVSVNFGPLSLDVSERPPNVAFDPVEVGEKPNDLDVLLLGSQSGRIELDFIVTNLKDLFPYAAKAWGEAQISSMIATTSLVGMICPGLHSIYGGVRIKLCAPDGKNALLYWVQSYDDRFRRIEMMIEGDGLRGAISCFSRNPPVKQPALRELSKSVNPARFVGRKALVVGGSRGLGELTAKFLAAGGAEVVVTYAVGRTEAEDVQAEIVAWGGKCEIVPFDVLAPSNLDSCECIRGITSVYYFATPNLHSGRTELFSPERLRRFLAFYVDGFYNVMVSVYPYVVGRLGVFYPSSVAVESRPKSFGEYAMAKAAGEILCTEIGENLPGVEVVVARLPRLPTDLTMSVAHVTVEDATVVLIPYIMAVEQIKQ